MGAAIFYPVFAQFALTVVLLLSMGWARRQALMAQEVRYSEIALDETRWPEGARKLSNCYRNQFELPVIFYLLCIIAFQTANADGLLIALAWGFVFSRIIHAYIHTTSNIVPRRGAAFAVGLLIVALMIGVLFARLLFASA